MPSFKLQALIPPGLLGFLQLKQHGQGLVNFPDVLQGTIELRDWYLQARAQWSQTSHGLTINATDRASFAAFAPNSIVVPDNEWWFVHQYTVTGRPSPGAGAARIANLYPAMVAQDVGTLRPVALSAGFTSNARTDISPDNASDHCQLDVSAFGFFAPSGAVLGFAHGTFITAPGTVDYDGFIRYTPLIA